ncbi:hypothetical protein [Bradyrhizobium sp. WSM3983]|nr:hypothetical protein [Bradyrhizobium sp. WSM3983]
MDASNVATEGPSTNLQSSAQLPTFDEWTQMPEAMHCSLTTSAKAV